MLQPESERAKFPVASKWEDWFPVELAYEYTTQNIPGSSYFQLFKGCSYAVYEAVYYFAASGAEFLDVQSNAKSAIQGQNARKSPITHAHKYLKAPRESYRERK